MISARQAILLFLAVSLSACQVADPDSPAALKQALEKSGWTAVEPGTAGYSVSLDGIERRVDGIRAERDTPAGKLSLAVGRFSAKVGWLSALTGGSPRSVRISGAGLLLDTSKTSFWWPEFDWPGWPAETAEALETALSGGKGVRAPPLEAEVVAKIGEANSPVTATLGYSGGGDNADGTIRLVRSDNELNLKCHVYLATPRLALVSFQSDIGGISGNLSVERDKIELQNDVDFSLLGSFISPDLVLKLGKRTQFTRNPDGYSLMVANAETGVSGKLTLRGSFSVLKESGKIVATFTLGESPAVFEWTGGKLSRVELTGKASDLKWPAEAGKLATLSVGEFLQPYWDGKPVDLSELRFEKIRFGENDEIARGGETTGPAFFIVGKSRLPSGEEAVAEWETGYSLSRLKLQKLADTLPFLTPLKRSTANIQFLTGVKATAFMVTIEHIDTPISEFANSAFSVQALMGGAIGKSIFSSRINSILLDFEYIDGRLNREVQVFGDRFALTPVGDKSGRIKLKAKLKASDRTELEIGYLKFTGPLFTPKIDFADGESRGRFLELMASEFK